MMFLSEYSKWKSMVAAGKLSNKSLRRLRKAKLIKSEKRYNKGLAKGTRNILKQTGSKEVDAEPFIKTVKKSMNAGQKKIQAKAEKKLGSATKYMTIPNKAGTGHDITSPKRKKRRGAHQIYRRHEADEASAAKNMLDKKQIPIPRVTSASKTRGLKGANGAHYSTTVLSREKRNTDYAKNAYKGKGTGKGAKGLERARKNTRVHGTTKSEYELQRNKKLRKRVEKRAAKANEKQSDQIKKQYTDAGNKLEWAPKRKRGKVKESFDLFVQEVLDEWSY